MSKPTKRKSATPSIMQRSVTRIVTPGTLTEDSLLDSAQNNFLCCLSVLPSASSTSISSSVPSASVPIGIAWLDVSTGSCYCMQSTSQDALSDLVRYPPAEIVVAPTNREGAVPSDPVHHLAGVVNSVRSGNAIGLDHVEFTERSGSADPTADTDHATLARLVAERFPDTAVVDSGFEDMSLVELRAMLQLLDYLAWTQQGSLPALALPVRLPTAGTELKLTPELSRVGHSMLHTVVEIDPSTRRSLELSAPQGGVVRTPLPCAMDGS